MATSVPKNKTSADDLEEYCFVNPDAEKEEQKVDEVAQNAFEKKIASETTNPLSKETSAFTKVEKKEKRVTPPKPMNIEIEDTAAKETSLCNTLTSCITGIFCRSIK